MLEWSVISLAITVEFRIEGTCVDSRFSMGKGTAFEMLAIPACFPDVCRHPVESVIILRGSFICELNKTKLFSRLTALVYSCFCMYFLNFTSSMCVSANLEFRHGCSASFELLLFCYSTMPTIILLTEHINILGLF